ncbi:ATP12 family chaperone protein [Sphingomonas edaphi]|uniref:GNAT family N-acetyltransferase n=1 Tax=Sphingomonas edaphi TaxID=2315689 RepID=A0A418PZK8_9SPHN|nr:ATP12 family protein [Sphingomonas edaphi]RIX29124.1 GNAT family N-acetyltransferase [Sphingomonas edaphi]
MKRFWGNAAAVASGDGFAIELDGRRVKTPARADLLVPTTVLAEAMAAEWNECGEIVDPRAMPLTGLANAAIDRVSVDKDGFAAGIARYGESDLTCYRAEGPDLLVARQSEAWDALLGWARRRYDVDFACVSGVMHVPQPEETVRKLVHAVAALDAFRLAALSQLVTIGGSLVAGLAVVDEMMPAEGAWEAVSLDDRWQMEHWGADAEAQAALDARRRDFMAAARFLDLLR